MKSCLVRDHDETGKEKVMAIHNKVTGELVIVGVAEEENENETENENDNDDPSFYDEYGGGDGLDTPERRDSDLRMPAKKQRQAPRPSTGSALKVLNLIPRVQYKNYFSELYIFYKLILLQFSHIS